MGLGSKNGTHIRPQNMAIPIGTIATSMDFMTDFVRLCQMLDVVELVTVVKYRHLKLSTRSCSDVPFFCSRNKHLVFFKINRRGLVIIGIMYPSVSYAYWGECLTVFV